MKASLKWLKEYVDITISPEDLAEALTMAGIHVASLGRVEDDYVFDFEITSNRSDCLSIIGLAREIAAITGSKLKLPAELAGSEPETRAKLPIPVEIKDKELCPRYTAHVIRNINVGISPDGLRSRLAAVGIRPVNNIVDITNFLLMETGQPMHAFDLDKLKGAVVIRSAKKGEAIKLIDGSVKELREGMLVISDDTGPIALAGIMGGSATEITPETRSVLLESAYFDPVSVRRTARALGLASESSYRFERRVDLGMIVPASIRASCMIRDLADGTSEGFLDIDHTDKDKATKKISFDPKHTIDILGIDISAATQKKILDALSFTISGKKAPFGVLAPAGRRDITQEVDVIEEIARIYGYNKIPETIPHQVGNASLLPREDRVRREIRRILSGSAAREIISYNLATRSAIGLFDHDDNATARILNPRSKEQEVMVQTLIAGMARVIAWNINRKNTDLSLFEVGKSYKKLAKDKYQESPRLSIGMTGQAEGDWISPRRKVTIYDLKGMVETLLFRLGIDDIKYVKSPKHTFLSTAVEIDLRGACIGIMGPLSQKTLKELDIKEEIFVAELYLETIMKEAVLEKMVTPVPKYPSIVRDISTVVDASITAGAIITAIREKDSGLLKKISLLSRYQGKQIPEGKTGLLYRLEYRDDERTLTDEEVDKEHNGIKEHLVSKLNITFR